MRPGRVAVLACMLVLAVLGSLRGTPTTAPAVALAGQGSGAVAPVLVTRLVTDGYPQVLALPVRRPADPAQDRPAASRPASRRPTRVRSTPARTVAAPAVVRGPRATTARDTYPWATDTSGGSDPWGFTKRQCVSYVAWRLADAGRPLDNARDGWGSALHWNETAQRLGFTVGSRPALGAVAQWEAGERSTYWSSPSAATADGTFTAGSLGHVAWVTKVYADGSVLVAQYNGMDDRSYSTMRVRAPRYLYL